MQRFERKRNEVMRKWFYLPSLIFVLWGALTVYSDVFSSSYPDEQSGKVYTDVVRGEVRYITFTEYVLHDALLFGGMSLFIILGVADRIQAKRELDEIFPPEKDQPESPNA